MSDLKSTTSDSLIDLPVSELVYVGICSKGNEYESIVNGAAKTPDVGLAKYCIDTVSVPASFPGMFPDV